MKRFPLVFLSLVILVTCTWLASSNPRVGKAAPDRTIPWWFGDYYDDFYHEYACVDGMNLWVMAVEGQDSEDPVFTLKGYKRIPHTPIIGIVDVQLPFQFTGAAPYEGAPYAEHTIMWDQELEPGTVVLFQAKSDAFIGGLSYPYKWQAYIRDCRVPTPPVPSQYRRVYARDFEDGEWWNLEISIPANGCVSDQRLIGNTQNFVIGDVDVSIDVMAYSPALLTATLTSPGGTSVKFIDENHSPGYTFGQIWEEELGSIDVAGAQRDWKWPGFANTLVFDDDSVFELENMEDPYIDMVVKPWPDKLKALNGEGSAGYWNLEICNGMSSGDATLRKWAIILEKDSTPPTITDVAATVLSPNSAVIEWQTDEPADSLVSYGTVSGKYPLKTNKSAFVTNHAITLTSLTPGTTYFFIVSSTDDSGNPTQSMEDSFTTESDEVEHTLAVATSGQGTVQINPNKPTYQSGEVVSLTAVPNNGYTFSGWSGDASGTANPVQITMDGNKSVTATFTAVEPNTYTLLTSVIGSGTITRNPDSEAYQSGDVVTLTAVPSDGYTFSGWSGDASGTANPIQITMNGNKSVTASFAPVAPNTYTLNTPSSVGGSIARNPDKQTYQSGEVVTLTAVPANGYQFDGWTGDASGMGNPFQITMDSNKSVVATFTPIESSDDFIYFMPSVLSN